MLFRAYLLLPLFMLFSSVIAFFGFTNELPPFLSAEKVLAEPDLRGPDGICLSAASGFAYAEFTGGGDPTDIFNWSIVDEAGFEVYNQSGAGVNKITFAFSKIGTYQVNLKVYRGGDQNYYQASKAVIVQDGPQFSLPPDVVLCGNDPVTIYAVSLTDPNFDRYTFEWLNADRTVIGRENALSITEEGRYFIRIISTACTVEATTYAGPPLEVEVSPSTNVACLGQTVTYSPDTPISASWSYQKAGQSERTVLGEFFTLNLNTGDLEGLGDYTIFFSAADEKFPDCPVELSFPLQVNEGAEFTLTKLSDAEDCDATDGAFRITAQSQLDELRINGIPDAVFNNLSPNEVREISGLAPKVYVVSGTLDGCTVTKSISIENENFDAPIEFTAIVTEEGACSSSGLQSGEVILDFQGGPGRYTIYAPNGDEIDGAFARDGSVTEDLPGGTYQVQVRDAENCTSPNVVTFTVPSPRQVSFSAPATVTACEFYEFTPESEQDLTYTLTFPDGSTQTESAEPVFMLEESGTYSLLATDNDPASTLCPRRRNMEVTINEQIEFDYSKRFIDCYGNQIFTAELGDMEVSDVVIRWLDEAGNFVGREVEFFPPSEGNFSLDVQPRRSSSCPATPIPFEVEIPNFQVPVEIKASAFCGTDPATLTMEADSDEIKRTQWFFTDSLGNTAELLEFQDKREIEVLEEGTYEVIIRNIINCELGRDTVTLVKSDPIVLELDEVYQICSEENVYPTIDPGPFETYSWSLDGVKIDSLQFLKVASPGQYELQVTDVNGCEATASFEVLERCATLVRFPNAITLGPQQALPGKDFRVFADKIIDEVEVYVYSRTGELVFHCSTSITDSSQPVCLWDGLLNGKKIPVGTYPLTVQYRSQQHQINDKVNGSLTVIE